jgi:hypothetical protein
LLDGLGALTINGATDRDACAQHFQNGANEVFGVALVANLLSDVDDVGHLDLAVVEDVLGLLSVSWGFFKSFKNQGWGGWHHSYEAHSVLNHDFDLDFDTFPFKSCFLDVFADFLGWKTDRAALGGKRCCCWNFTSDDLHIEILLFGRICCWFWGHLVFLTY